MTDLLPDLSTQPLRDSVARRGFDLDQTSAYDPTEPEPIPDFDFDQDTGA